MTHASVTRNWRREIIIMLAIISAMPWPAIKRIWRRGMAKKLAAKATAKRNHRRISIKQRCC